MISFTTESCINVVDLVGGGTNPMPGEVSLALDSQSKFGIAY